MTSWPVFIKAIMEQDVNYQSDGPQLKKLFPYLYYLGSEKVIFNWSSFFSILFNAFFDSMLCFIIPLYSFHLCILTEDGINADIWSLSFTIITSIFACVTIKVWMHTKYFTCVNLVFYLGLSVFVYIVVIWVIELL